MLRETKILEPHKLSLKEKIIKQFKLTLDSSKKIEEFIDEIYKHNLKINIVGSSTLTNPWRSHVLDSIQISNFIHNKNSTILDMGTGAGIPGLILAINDFTNVSLIDSSGKKIRFIESVCLKLNIKTKIYHQRIESLINKKFDYIISRALANLNKLFFYSQKLLNSNTVLIFLKGKRTKEEIHEARKNWKFQYTLKKSASDERGKIVIVKYLDKINA